MAKLREPDEVKTRSTKSSRAVEPKSYQVRQAQGLPNTALDRHKLKMEQKKLDLQQKNKEDDRKLKIQQHQEKRQDTWAKTEETRRAREEAATDKRSETHAKAAEKKNLQDFHNFLYSEYGGVIDDKGTRGIPLDIEKRAARYMGQAATDGAGAIEKFKQDFTQEQTVRQQYQTVLPELIKARQKALGVDVLPAGEVAALDKADVDTMRRAVSGWQEKQTAVKAKADADLATAGKNYDAAYPSPDVAGGKPRYTADEFGGPGVGGNLPIRPDLNPGQANEAFNDVVDRAVAAKGGGFLPTAAGAWMKYMPGARDLVDPNTPLRQGIRDVAAPALRTAGEKVGEAVAGIRENLGAGTGVDLIPSFENPTAPVSPAVPTAEPKPAPAPTELTAPVVTPEATAAAGEMGASLTRNQPLALPEKSFALPPTPELPAGPNLGVTAAEGPVAPAIAKPHIFSGLAETVKNMFTTPPGQEDRNQNVWATLAQKARDTGGEVAANPAIAAPGENPGFSPGTSPAIKRPEDEQDRAFPRAM